MKNFYYEKSIVERKLPENFREIDKCLFEAEFTKEFAFVTSKEFNDIIVYSNGICSQNGKFLIELFYNKKKIDFKTKIRLYKKTFFPVLKKAFHFNKKNIDKGLLLTDHFSEGFFHWFADIYQKLEALSLSNDMFRDYILIIPATNNSGYVKETLKLYNIKYYIIQKDETVFVDKLIYIPSISPTGNYRPELMLNMRKRFQKYYNISSTNKKVFITRSKALKRKILNENELVPFFENNNIQIVAMEDLNFKEQYKIVAEADLLISLHGAGLTHMLWMKQNSKVLEIRSREDSTNNCYFSLASDLNLKYYYFLADKTDNKSTQLTNFKIDVNEFEKTVNEILLSSERNQK